MTELMMTTVLGPENLLFETDYALAPDKNYVEITRGSSTTIHAVAATLFTISSSAASRCHSMGDALLFSDKTPTFIPGDGGFDQRLFLEERYSLPIQLPAIRVWSPSSWRPAADGVSYGFLPAPAGNGNFIQKHIDIYSRYAGAPTDHSLVIPSAPAR